MSHLLHSLINCLLMTSEETAQILISDQKSDHHRQLPIDAGDATVKTI